MTRKILMGFYIKVMKEIVRALVMRLTMPNTSIKNIRRSVNKIFSFKLGM